VSEPGGRSFRMPIRQDETGQITIDELLGQPIAPSVGPPPGSIQERFEQFHEANPHVLESLVALADEWSRETGGARCGIGMLYETLRFRRGLVTRGEDFKLNNNYRSRYVRLIVEERPDLAGLFETRELLSA
jgi:hypothetical protein